MSDIVLEKYANANLIWRDGAVDGSRRLRTGYRSSAAKLFAIGIPPSRIGLMIGFQTGAGSGGREGLQPRSRWFDVAKWQALAAEQVSRELRLTHVWSWGWAQRNERSNDPDKTFAACVWLWARDPGLCDAPEVLGKELDADRRAGQIDLPAGDSLRVRRQPADRLRSRRAGEGDERPRARADRARRACRRASACQRQHRADTRRGASDHRRSLRRERSLVPCGSRGAGASLAVARAIVGDELRRAEIHEGLVTPRPSTADVTRFRATFAGAPARRLVVSPAPSWLPEGTGLALATSAPRAVFELASRRTVKLRTAEGVFTVRALEDAASLGAVPLAIARPAIVRELTSERRADAYVAWTIRQQKNAESRLVCERDRLPEHGVVSLSSFAPFLSLHEAGSDDGAVR